MAAARERLAWAAVAFVAGGLVGALLLLPPQGEPNPFALPGRQEVPATILPAQARVQNSGSQDVSVTLTIRDGTGRTVQQVEQVVPARSQGDLPAYLDEEGTYAFEAAFVLVANPGSISTAEASVTVGSCGPERTAGVLFEVSTSRSGVRVDGMEEVCF